jgi:hypothetical protein
MPLVETMAYFRRLSLLLCARGFAPITEVLYKGLNFPNKPRLVIGDDPESTDD